MNNPKDKDDALTEHKNHLRKRVRQLTRNRGTDDLLNERDGRRKCFTCPEKLREILTKHHIKPVAKDGESWVENIVRLCPNCHALVHWCNTQLQLGVKDRADYLARYDLDRERRFKIALLSTEAVYVNEDGNIRPRAELVPDEPIVYTELFSIFNWWPEGMEEEVA